MDDLKTIILVDDNPTNLMIGSTILRGLYHVIPVLSGEKLITFLETSPPPDLILLDIEMPGMDGFETITQLKANPHTADIPVIFLSANTGLNDMAKGFTLGAVDYIVKPYYPPLLIKHIGLHLLVESQSKQLQDYDIKIQNLIRENKNALGDLQQRLLKTVIALVERREEVSGGHVERTRKYVEVLLDVLIKNNIYEEIINSWEKEMFLQSTLLYDLGKISIKDSILMKPGKLAKNEYNEMKKHTLMGVKIIEDIKMEMHKESAETSVLDYAKLFAGYHHEKWDGTGYPYGLQGSNIPLPGRLMAIADVYDALIIPKSYKKSYTHEEATEIITQGKGTHFDPVLVDLFISSADKFRTISRQV
jgi:putative two-component system response regulator